MKLQWVEFENLETGLKIERIYFNKDITLLVGLSGAGKTQVLNAVKYSLSLAVDKNTTLHPYSLVLIDEFENGLGVNCIDILCELMLSERNDLQLIITSHHPKIINAIDKEKWKIIERDGSVIRNRISQELGIGNSQHDAYFNLINRWEFEGKI